MVDGELAIEFLREFFPVRALYLGEKLTEANEVGKAMAGWREKQLFKFIGLLTQNADDLERAYREKRITKLAWAARNILELSIWIDYCNRSDVQAKQLRDDSARDLLGFAKAIQAIYIEGQGSPDLGLKKTEQDLISFAQNVFGVTGLDDDFKRVSEAAKDVGRENNFRQLNKLFSKFAHPTAISLNAVVAVEADAGIRTMFLNDGVELATDALTTIREVIVGSFPFLEKDPIIRTAISP